MEEWRDIQDFPNYQVSNLGNVRNKTRKNVLKPRPCEKNYGYICYSVNITHTNKKQINQKVHLLVAKAFIPNPDNKNEIDHIDRNTANNKVENLRWSTRSENCLNTKTRSDNTSGERNIYFCSQNQKWKISKTLDKKTIHLGFYDTFEEAKIAKETNNYNRLTSNTKEKYIWFNESTQKFVFEKRTNDIRIVRNFKTLEEAIEARDEYLATQTEQSL